MDFLVVAAVAGAGCLAKYLNKLSKNGDGSSFLLSLEDSNFENAESGRDSIDRRGSNVNSHDCLLTTELVSNRENVRPFKSCNESDELSASNFNDIGCGNEQSCSNVGGGSCSFLLPDLSAGKLGHRTSHRTKHLLDGHITRPSNSLESCLMAQLCKEHAKMEEYVLLPSTATGWFLVSDGNQMISRENDDDSFSGLTGSEEYKLHREASKVKDESALFGVPYLPQIGSSNDAKKMREFNAGSGRSGRLSPSSNVFIGKHIHTQHDATFLINLGISFGIMTSISGNKREVDKLRELLKQTENLVQDLQEELEMKDSMRVKELHNENYGSQGTCDHSFTDKEMNGFSPEKHKDKSPITDCKKSYDQKEEESSESMSKIEAELEAELERLGLNMNESSPERPLSEFVELDPDFVADFAQGELQTDVIGGKDFVHSESELNEDDSDSVVPVNYVVSPHELTLRLHEVIQSRLEGRVQELEIAVENSQRKLWFMESEQHESHPQKYFSSYGQASFFTKANECEPITEPLVMNLFGESPSSHEEIIKIDDFEENSPSSIIHISEYKVEPHSHCGANDLLTHSTVNEERLSRELSSGEVTMLEGLSSSNYELNDVIVTGDENCECECDYDEVERQLIRQIVERTKKGSPVLQNARRVLYAMDED